MPSFSADHSEIQIRRKTVSIDLRGTGTAWTGATPFAVSNVAGVTLSGTSVGSGTAARLTLATGATTGTLHVTDGATTVNVAVKNYRRPRYVPRRG